VAAATGAWRRTPDGQWQGFGITQGLPSADVRRLRALDDGGAVVATAAGAARIRLVATPMPVAGGPPGVEVSLIVGGIGQVPGWTAGRCTDAQRLLAGSFGPPAKVEQRTLPEGVALVLTCPAPGPDGSPNSSRRLWRRRRRRQPSTT